MIELWCGTCFDLGPVVVVEPERPAVAIAPPLAPARPRRRWLGGAAIALSIAGGLVVVRAATPRGIAAAAAPVATTPLLDEDPEPAVSYSAISHEVAPPHVAPARHEDQWPMPDADGTPLDQRFPSLAGWVHPVADSAELVPEQQTRWFGAAREGIVPRPECGLGHCGIDLDGPRGRPVVAVAPGTVVRIERSELGRDKRSGRYVRVEHADGTLTAYMHLDDIADGLEVGDRVVAGQQLGTLGATAVYRAAPHLHFDLAVPEHTGTIGDNNDNHYVDPAPFLSRAKVIPESDVTVKPGARLIAGRPATSS